jgi:hypothetical protein
MITETNVAVTTEAAPQLKSTDTSYKATLVVPEAKPEKVAPKVEKEPVAAAEPAVPVEGEKDDAPDAASQQQRSEKRLPRWMKERLERERQVTEARTREAMLREFQQTQPKAPVEPEKPKLKTLEDFDFDSGKYTDYLVDEKLKQREADREASEANRKRAEAAESFKARIDSFEERAGDGAWQDIVESPLNTDPAFKPLTDMFMGDDHDLDIAHYLSENLAEAKRINGLSPLQKARELAKLAEKFEGGSQPEAANAPAPAPAPLPKRTTSAPPPPKTVSGSGKPSVDIGDPNLSTAERIAAWRKAGKR